MFDRYRVDGVMPDADSDEEDDAPSSSSSTPNQGGYRGMMTIWRTIFKIILCSKCIWTTTEFRMCSEEAIRYVLYKVWCYELRLTY